MGLVDSAYNSNDAAYILHYYSRMDGVEYSWVDTINTPYSYTCKGDFVQKG